ncbi:MAG: VOC family protein, partial [Desulfarculaceae bacterium]
SLPQVDIRKTPLMVDKEPSETTRQGPDPVPGRWPAPLRPTPAGERAAFPGQGKELTDPDKQTW